MNEATFKRPFRAFAGFCRQRFPSRRSTSARIGVLWIALAISGPAMAADLPMAAQDAATVSPLIGETTALVVKIDPARLALPKLPEAIASALPGSEAAYRQWAEGAAEQIATLRKATGGQPVYATVGIPLSQGEWPVFFFLRETPEVDRDELLERLPGGAGEASLRTHEGLVVATPIREVDLAAALGAMVPSPRGELESAFRAVGDYPVVVLLIPPAYVRRTVVELLPELPPQLGGGSSEVLTDGLLWAALGLDPASLRAELVVQSASEEAAGRLAARLPQMLQSVGQALSGLQQEVPPESVQLVLSAATPTVEGDRLVFRVETVERWSGALHLIESAVAKTRDSARRKAHADRFKQILLAMHNYHDVYGVFPPRDELRDEQGRTGLSWRVHLLPFVDQQKLYEEFRLDESWDSPHNKTLIEKMPDVFRGPALNRPPGHTTFLAPVGEDTVFGGQKATRFQNITDGTSNTVVLVEVQPERAAPWTAPEDYRFDPEAPAEGLQIGANGRFLAALADGSVNQLRGDIRPEMLRRLFRKSDGNPIDWNEVR